MSTNEEPKIWRTLHLKFTLHGADSEQLSSMMRAAAPFYQMFGTAHFRLLRNADDPTKFIQVIEYETPELLSSTANRWRATRASKPICKCGARCCPARSKWMCIRRFSPPPARPREGGLKKRRSPSCRQAVLTSLGKSAASTSGAPAFAKFEQEGRPRGSRRRPVHRNAGPFGPGACYSVIRKSGYRFSEKIMLKQKARAGCRSNHNSIPL